MDSPDDFLLSDGVCRQLGIIQYLREVRPVKETCKSGASTQHSTGIPLLGPGTVPIAKVILIKSVHLLPHHSIVAEVVCSEDGIIQLVEQLDDFQDKTAMQVEATCIVKPGLLPQEEKP